MKLLLMFVALGLAVMGGFMPGTGYWSGLIVGVALMRCSDCLKGEP